MDIVMTREDSNTNTFFGLLAKDKLQKYFDKYPFLHRVNIYLRGKAHPTKKVKLSTLINGKEIFVKATGNYHEDAFRNAIAKLDTQLLKYKTVKYNKR